MYKLWVDFYNLCYVEVSVEVVLRIVGIINLGCVFKEMFVLNFIFFNYVEILGMFGWNGFLVLL